MLGRNRDDEDNGKYAMGDAILRSGFTIMNAMLLAMFKAMAWLGKQLWKLIQDARKKSG